MPKTRTMDINYNVKERILPLFSKEGFLIMTVFVSSFLFALFHLSALPFHMYGWDDFQLIYQVTKVSFTKLLLYTFFAPLQLFQGFLAIGAYQRTVHGLFLKLSYLLTGTDPSGYFFLRSLFFSFTAVLVYLFMKKTTSSSKVSFITAFLYTSLPVIYAGVRWIGDAEVFSQFFLLLSIYLFLHWYGRLKYSLYIGIFVTLISAIFCLKARESGIILIPIFSTFLLLKWKEWNINKNWWLVVCILLLYLLPSFFTMYVLPQFSGITPPARQVIITEENILSNFKYLLFYNPYTKIDGGEQTPVIFSLHQYFTKVPGSVLGSLGFILAWYCIFMLCFFLFFFFQAKIKKSNEANTIFSLSDHFLILCLWFFFAALLMTIYVNPSDYSDIRYAGVAGLPFILLCISFSYQITVYLQKKTGIMKPKISQMIVPFFIFLLVVSIAVNVFFTSIYLAGGIGSRHRAMETISKTIVQDFYNQTFDNTLFFPITECSGMNKSPPCSLPCVFSANISPQQVTVTEVYFLSFTTPITEENINKTLDMYGIVYVISSLEPSAFLEQYKDVSLVKEIHPCDRGYYCYAKDTIKSILNIPYFQQNYFSRESKFFVHKIVRKQPSFDTPVKIICEGAEGLPHS